MPFRHLACALLAAGVVPVAAVAQSETETPPHLSLELNAMGTVGDACRLTFVARNGTGSAIEKAVFETVIFDASGGVVSLSLFDFRDLPPDRPRVRQFDLSGMDCDSVGQALINGASTCLVEGAESDICQDLLKTGSRIDVELTG